MLASAHSAALEGIDACQIEVEVDFGLGLPAVIIVGLPDAAVRESRERVHTAIINSGYEWPARRITVNLAPADTRKEGADFDLPIALGILAASEQIPAERLAQYAVIGELALDGRVRPVRGILPIVETLKRKGIRGILVPAGNSDEAGLVEGIDALPVEFLTEAVAFFNGTQAITPHRTDTDALFGKSPASPHDFAEVKGQQHVKRALTIAAAGGHNVLMIGPPGSGKTMLASRLPGILPPLRMDEALEATRIHSVAHCLPKDVSLVAARPFRSPHHSVSDAGLIGGGSVPRPGEVSLAHHGVLFLDELTEFNRKTLEMLRQPLEDGSVTIARARGRLSFPSRFMLVAAMNPCPCGFANHPTKSCGCTQNQIRQYMGKISGPLMDRIDIHLDVPPVEFQQLSTHSPDTERSADIRSRVIAARDRQTRRFTSLSLHSNAELAEKQLDEFAPLNRECRNLLEVAMREFNLSARAYVRIRRLALTIADLDGVDTAGPVQISEAIQYRTLDRGIIE